MEKPRWKVRSTEPAIDSPFLKIRRDVIELPDGSILGEYYVRESNGFCMVFAVTPDDQVVLINEYRYGIDEVLLECPAGTISEGEDPLECARRELREETGYTSTRWEPLFAVPSEPARSNAIMHAYLALDARCTAPTEHDRSEHIETALRPLDDIDELLLNPANGVRSSLATIAVAQAALGRLRKVQH